MDPKATVLVVEDSDGLRENLVRALTIGGYDVKDAPNGLSAVEMLGAESFDVVVTDIKMPGMDGLSLLDRILAMNPDPEPAVILITAHMTLESAVSSLKKGAYDYITKPFKAEQLLGTVKAALDKRRLKLENVRLTRELRELNRALEEKVQLRTSQLRESQNKLQRSYLETIRSFAVVLEERDAYTQGHSRRVTEYSVRIAEEMGLADKQIKALQIGGALHDIGKIGIPEDTLRKPSNLSEDEWEIMQEHPDKGARMVEPLSFLSEERVLIRHHHERWDGQGYPDALAGEQIPLLSRVLCVADAFDAMTSTRSYRRRMTLDIAVGRLLEGKGTQFDPEIVDVFIDCLGKHGIVTMMDCIILAAGQGKRMNGSGPKVLVELDGKPLLGYVLDLVKMFGMRDLYVVVGHGAEEVENYVERTLPEPNDGLGGVTFVHQRQQLGTAHAVMQVAPHLARSRNGLLILSGDVPLLSFDTVNRLVEEQMRTEAHLVLATATVDNPGSLGRIKRKANGELEAIVEAADASSSDLETKEINSGVYCLGTDHRFIDLLSELDNDNAQGEYYLTDAIRLLLERGGKVVPCEMNDAREATGINTKEDLERARQYLHELNRFRPNG
ncbi:MAG: response regulator [Candidatus Coatesbacteria bacterium]|nr:response regulator [Candidatus Coatesbacteria bacterium]